MGKPFRKIILVGATVALTVFIMLAVGPRLRVQRARATADAAFNETKLFLLLEKDHPEIRAAFIDMAVRRAQGDASVSAFAWGQAELSKHFVSYAARASDDSLLSFGSLIVELLDTLRSRSDAACVTFLFGGAAASSFRMDSYFPREMQERLVAVQEQLITSAVENPGVAATEMESGELMGQLLERLREKHGEPFVDKLGKLENPSASGISNGDVCAVTLGMYREALALPPPSNAKLLRALFADARAAR